MKNTYTEITKCRISDSENLTTVLSLGNMDLTGVFPKSKDEKVNNEDWANYLIKEKKSTLSNVK